jgi:L-ascorbate metabolism protein UlaG (beta-lactamase superfamily)
MRVALNAVVLVSFCAAGCERKPAPEATRESAPHESIAPVPPPVASASAPAPASQASAGGAAAAGKGTVTDTLETSAGPVTVTPILHGTLALGFSGKTIVIDPYSKAPAGALPKADLVLITDIHQDHYDPEGITAVRKADTVFVAPAVVVEKLPEAKTLKNGEKLELLGVRIEATPMYNKKRGPEAGKLFHDKGRGNGYLLGFGDKKVYVSGDTECTAEMKALKKVDLAFVCMNLPYTMPPEEAAECVKAFKPAVVIPFHYRGSDLKVFQSALADTKGVEVRIRDFYAGGG